MPLTGPAGGRRCCVPWSCPLEGNTEAGAVAAAAAAAAAAEVPSSTRGAKYWLPLLLLLPASIQGSISTDDQETEKNHLKRYRRLG